MNDFSSVPQLLHENVGEIKSLSFSNKWVKTLWLTVPAAVVYSVSLSPLVNVPPQSFFFLYSRHPKKHYRFQILCSISITNIYLNYWCLTFLFHILIVHKFLTISFFGHLSDRQNVKICWIYLYSIWKISSKDF